MFLVAYGLSLSVSFSFTKGILLIKKRISCIGYQKKLIPNSCGGNLLCILILYLPSSTAVGGCLFRRRRTLFDTISIPLLKLVVPPVEIDVKHDHRAGRQATEQKPVTMGKVVMNWHDRTNKKAANEPTFDRWRVPMTWCCYHRLGMHTAETGWTSSKLRLCLGRLP